MEVTISSEWLNSIAHINWHCHQCDCCCHQTSKLVAPATNNIIIFSKIFDCWIRGERTIWLWDCDKWSSFSLHIQHHRLNGLECYYQLNCAYVRMWASERVGACGACIHLRTFQNVWIDSHIYQIETNINVVELMCAQTTSLPQSIIPANALKLQTMSTCPLIYRYRLWCAQFSKQMQFVSDLIGLFASKI